MAAAMTNGTMLTCEATSAFAVENISPTPMAKASDVSLTSVITSLPMAGMIRLTTCGTTMCASVWNLEYPRTSAASYCPRGTDCRPER